MAKEAKLVSAKRSKRDPQHAQKEVFEQMPSMTLKRRLELQLATHSGVQVATKPKAASAA
jgi:hypothetical protein